MSLIFCYSKSICDNLILFFSVHVQRLFLCVGVRFLSRQNFAHCVVRNTYLFLLVGVTTSCCSGIEPSPTWITDGNRAYALFNSVVREIKVSNDWFGCAFVVFLYITKVFSESVAQSSSCFAGGPLIPPRGKRPIEGQGNVKELNVIFSNATSRKHKMGYSVLRLETLR